MEFKREDCSFNIPDRPTVRQQMGYMGKISGLGDGLYPLRFWEGAKHLLTDWKCEAIPDKDIDLDAVDSPKITDILIWAGLAVWDYMQKLEELPKN